ncbi:MAG: ribbon-helix-helix domain-containing protein [Kineosporiaceae bacterium]
MKLSVSLPEDDVAYLDAYAAERGLGSRSAALAQAVELLRRARLAEEYAQAIDEWEGGADGALWDATAPDGVAVAPQP